MKSLLPLAFLILFLNACSKTEYVDIDLAPQLEIYALDVSSTPVGGATVKLYANESSFMSGENELETKTTGTDGKVQFENLAETIYYFYASKGDKNNFYEVVTFESSLEKNEIRVIETIIR